MMGGLQIRDWGAEALRAQAMEVVEEAIGCDEAAFFRFAHTPEGPRYVDMRTTGELNAKFQRISTQAPPPDNLTNATSFRRWSVTNPEPGQANRFQTVKEAYGLTIAELEGTPTVDSFYTPGDVSDQARALMFDGQEFLGFIGALRRGGAMFDTAEVRELQRIREVAHRLLHLARATERTDWSRAMHVIVDEDGAVVFADERAAQWLSPRRSEALGRALRERDIVTLDGQLIRAAFIDGPFGPLKHVTLSAFTPVRRSVLATLSPAQQRIAALATEGFTNREIARLMRLSPWTVKYHLSLIYDLHGIGGRGQLAAPRSAS